MKLVKIIILVIVSFIAIGCSKHLTEKDNKSYDSYVASFKDTLPKQVIQSEDNDKKILVYVGKEACPYCREFVPKLYQASLEAHVKVYYVDVEKAEDNPLELDTFLERYTIQYIPALIKLDGRGNFKVLDFDSEDVTVEQLKGLLK